MAMTDLETVWHGASHREIPPDAGVLANRAKAMTPRHRERLDVPCRGPRLTSDAMGRLLDAMDGQWRSWDALQRRAQVRRVNVGVYLARLVAQGFAERQQLPSWSEKGGRPGYAYRLAGKA